MPSRNIGIVVAMRREVAPLLVRARVRNADGVEFYELENCVVAVSGIGRRAAGKAAGALVNRYSSSFLVSAGLAGALTPKLKVGDVVHVREVIDAETGVHFDAQGGTESLVTALSVSGASEKRALAARTGAALVDMEASAVATVARGYCKEFAALKSISDELDFEMPPVGEFVNDSGKFETTRFAMFLSIRPKWWSAVRKLSANSRIATVNLTRALQHLIQYGLQRSEEKVFGA